MLALNALHACGWVHRDVSAGNVLIHDGVGKLADFEFAKAESDKGTHCVRTVRDTFYAYHCISLTGPLQGTAFFMAVEVEDGSYLFDSPTRSGDGDQLCTVLEEDEGETWMDLSERCYKRPRLDSPSCTSSRSTSSDGDSQPATEDRKSVV